MEVISFTPLQLYPLVPTGYEDWRASDLT